MLINKIKKSLFIFSEQEGIFFLDAYKTRRRSLAGDEDLFGYLIKFALTDKRIELLNRLSECLWDIFELPILCIPKHNLDTSNWQNSFERCGYLRRIKERASRHKPPEIKMSTESESETIEINCANKYCILVDDYYTTGHTWDIYTQILKNQNIKPIMNIAFIKKLTLSPIIYNRAIFVLGAESDKSAIIPASKPDNLAFIDSSEIDNLLKQLHF